MEQTQNSEKQVVSTLNFKTPIIQHDSSFDMTMHDVNRDSYFLNKNTNSTVSYIPIDENENDPSRMVRPDESFIKQSHKTNTYQTTYNLCKCFAGAASFELPWAMKEAGAIGSGISILILAFFSYFTLKWLGTIGHYHPTIAEPSYPEISKVAYGKIGQYAAWFGIIAMTIGVCGSYLVFMGSSISVMVHNKYSFLTPEVCSSLLCIPLIFLTWLRSYKFLVPTSLMGLTALVFALCVTVTHGIERFPAWKHGHNVSLFKFYTYPLFLGNAAYLYLIHSVVLPIEQHLTNRPRRNLTPQYKSSLKYSISIVTIINVIFAEFLYLSFGSGTCGNVIDNLNTGLIKILVRIFLTCDLFFTYALFLFPVSESIERVLFNPREFGDKIIERKRNLLRFCLVVLSGVIAIGIPSFQQITGLTGVFGNNVLGLILPPILYLKLAPKYKNNIPIWEKTLAIVIFILGLLMFIIGTSYFIYDIVVHHNSEC